MPSHQGLTCQGWNWTLADIKAEGKETDVGAMYITDDGKTRLHIKIETEYRTTVGLCFRQSVANGVEVDWGDGSAIETFSNRGNTNILPSHTYTNIGEYVITLNPLNNCVLSLGNGNPSYNILGDLSNMLARYTLHQVFIGKNTTIMGYAFSNTMNLKNITVPNGITINQNAFTYARALILILPASITSLVQSIFDSFYSSKIVVSNLTNIQFRAFMNASYLSKIIIPKNVNSIESNAFYACVYISNLKIPASVTNIESAIFAVCVNVKTYDFSTHTSIPSLSNINAFTSIPFDCKIIVPDSLYEDWKVATNWSTYASYIIKKTDWEASQV